MTNPYKALHQHFQQASLKSVAQHNLNHREWQQHQTITERFKSIENKAERLHKTQYALRVNQEYRRLLRDRTSPQKHLKYPLSYGYDQLSPYSLKLQAQNNVDHRHQQRIAALAIRKNEAVNQVIEHSQHRQRQKGKLTNAFNPSAQYQTQPQN